MSMKANVEFIDLYNKLEDMQSGDMWNYVSKLLQRYVKQLMTKGIDVHGMRYKPYSAKYVNKRAKEGLTTKVNLEFTSNMKLSITARNTQIMFEVFITGAENNKKAEHVSEDREFLAWAKQTEEALNRYINNYFQLKGWL